MNPEREPLRHSGRFLEIPYAKPENSLTDKDLLGKTQIMPPTELIPVSSLDTPAALLTVCFFQNSTEGPLLIVDDDKWNSEWLAHNLNNDYQCVTAANAEEALELLEDRRFSLVLTDLKMPGASGFELCRTVKQKWPDTVVVIMSGANDSSCCCEARRAGAFEYLIKPLDFIQVSRTIKIALQAEQM
jgi:CheY-like chemotaxis protein